MSKLHPFHTGPTDVGDSDFGGERLDRSDIEDEPTGDTEDDEPTGVDE